MKVITFANNKGGVAKTTTTVNIAHGLALMLEMEGVEARILVVDTDSQAHATNLLTGNKEHLETNSLSGVMWAHNNKGDLQAALDNAIVTSDWHPKIDVLCAFTGMDATEEALVGRSGNVFFLRRILKAIEKKYDIVLIDTCPKFSLFTKMALLASDEVVIPVAPEYLDSDGLMSLISKVNDEREAWGSETPYVTGIVVVKYHQNVNGHKTIVKAIKTSSALKSLYLGTVPLNSEVSYANTDHKSIFAYNPGCAGAKAYGQITTQIANMIYSRA